MFVTFFNNLNILITIELLNLLLKGFDKMETAYDLFRKLLEVMTDIDRTLNEKSKVTDARNIELLDKKIDALEVKMYELKNRLKSIKL